LDAKCLLPHNWQLQKKLLATPGQRAPCNQVHKQSGDLELANQEFMFLKGKLLKFKGLPHYGSNNI